MALIRNAEARNARSVSLELLQSVNAIIDDTRRRSTGYDWP